MTLKDLIEPMAGPPSPRLTPEQKADKAQQARLALWKAIWEASQWMTLPDIQQACAGTIHEIALDEP